jgi:hypothetical protein
MQPHSSPAPKDPVLKWLLISFLVLTLALAAGVGILVWKFSPLIRVDEAERKVVALGGLIEIDGKAGKIKLGSKVLQGPPTTEFTGSAKIAQPSTHRLRLQFTNGHVALSPSADAELRWTCQLPQQQPGRKPKVDPGKHLLLINLEDVQGARCTLTVPAQVAVSIAGVNGGVQVSRPTGPLEIEMANGQVTFSPEPGRDYVFDVEIKNGMAHNLKSSSGPRAIPVKIRMANGIVVRN